MMRTKRQFVRTPKLPSSALAHRALPAVKAEAAQPRQAVVGPRMLPADGAELRQCRLQKYEDRLVKERLCQPGDLVNAVVQAGVAAGVLPWVLVGHATFCYGESGRAGKKPELSWLRCNADSARAARGGL